MGNVISIEIKAKVTRPEKIHSRLEQLGAKYIGEDHQIDTYFIVPKGRLKMREGNIEHNLIQYNRPENKSLKKSTVKLYSILNKDDNLKQLLTSSLGIDVVVQKKRKIYFIDNVKFHIDEIEDLGDFVEIEALDMQGNKSEEELSIQCNYYIDLFQINRNDFIPFSYSDLIRKKKQDY